MSPDIFQPILFGLSMFTFICWVIGGLFAALGVILRKSSAYWTRQANRATAGRAVEPEPWYVRMTTKMHGSRLMRRLLG